MARELADIVKELDASYNPQRQSLQQQISALPGQADSEIQGLQATQNQAFGDILNGARDRGLGFSGIPIGEQAQYTASTFLPAVAKVRQSQNQAKTSLSDALNNINLTQNQYAQSIRQSELDRDEQQRQFNEQLAESRRQAAAQTSAYQGLFNSNNSPTEPQKPGQYDTVDKQSASNSILGLLKTNNLGTIKNTIDAITKSANYGNVYDKYKLDLLSQYAGNTQYGDLLKRAQSYRPGSSNKSSAPAKVKVNNNIYKGSAAVLGL